jgi:hypothetical protein
MEEIHNFVARLIILPIAAWCKSIDTCPMFIPFMLPETFWCPAIGKPIGIHEGEQIGVSGGNNVGYIVIGRGTGAEGWVGAIAEVGPGRGRGC